MRRAYALVLALLLGVSACSGDDPDVRILRVHAASSLAAPLADLAEAFEADRAAAGERVEVQLDLAGSADLVARLEAGAPGDVLATADTTSLDRLDGALLAAEPRVFATNTLTLVTPPDDPAGIDSLAAATAEGIRLVVCAPEVPCGAAAVRVARAADVTLRPVSEERAVVDVLGKVRSGEADAGLVYATDAAAAGDAVRRIDVPEAAAVVNAYPIAPLAGSEHPDLAAAFVALVLSSVGRTLLAAAGFGTP